MLKVLFMGERLVIMLGYVCLVVKFRLSRWCMSDTRFVKNSPETKSRWSHSRPRGFTTEWVDLPYTWCFTSRRRNVQLKTFFTLLYRHLNVLHNFYSVSLITVSEDLSMKESFVQRKEQRVRENTDPFTYHQIPQRSPFEVNLEK